MILYDFVSKNRTLETNASPKLMQTISKMEIPANSAAENWTQMRFTLII